MWSRGLFAQHVGSSRTRAQTRVPCIGRWIVNHCATRDARHSFICLQISFLYSLKEDSWILMFTSAFNLLQYVFFWLNYMESLAPHRYVVLKGRTIISSFFTQLHIFSFDTTPKFIKRCSPFFLQAYLGMQVELPAIGLGGW